MSFIPGHKKVGRKARRGRKRSPEPHKQHRPKKKNPVARQQLLDARRRIEKLFEPKAHE